MSLVHEVLKTRLKDAVLHTSGDEWKRAAVEGPGNEIEAIQRARIMAEDLSALVSSLAAIDGPKDVVMVTADIDIPLGEIALLAKWCVPRRAHECVCTRWR